MPTNPTIPNIPQEDNVKKLAPFSNPIDAKELGKDFAVNAANAFFPNLTQVISTPTIIDANSLGILVQGAGFGAVKSFIAAAAMKGNEAVYKLRENEVLKGNATIYQNQLSQGYKTYFETDKPPIPNTNQLIGQYVFDRVRFANNKKVLYSVDGSGNVVESSKDNIPDLILNACIVSIDANRYVHQSIPVNSNAGTIKEIMAFGEYNIKITGHLVNDTKPKEYPIESIEALDDLCKTPTAVNIESTFLSIFGVSSIVITDYSIEQVEGFSGIVTFTITAVSDTQLPIMKGSESSFGSITSFQNPSTQ